MKLTKLEIFKRNNLTKEEVKSLTLLTKAYNLTLEVTSNITNSIPYLDKRTNRAIITRKDLELSLTLVRQENKLGFYIDNLFNTPLFYLEDSKLFTKESNHFIKELSISSLDKEEKENLEERLRELITPSNNSFIEKEDLTLKEVIKEITKYLFYPNSREEFFNIIERDTLAKSTKEIILDSKESLLKDLSNLEVENKTIKNLNKEINKELLESNTNIKNLLDSIKQDRITLDLTIRDIREGLEEELSLITKINNPSKNILKIANLKKIEDFINKKIDLIEES